MVTPKPLTQVERRRRARCRAGARRWPQSSGIAMREGDRRADHEERRDRPARRARRCGWARDRVRARGEDGGGASVVAMGCRRTCRCRPRDVPRSAEVRTGRRGRSRGVRATRVSIRPPRGHPDAAPGGSGRERAAGRGAGGSRRWCELRSHADVLGFVALLARSDVELDVLALVERLVAVTADVRVVDEDVVARLARDEAVTLVRIEELDRALCH